jgi:hypothetical protein
MEQTNRKYFPPTSSVNEGETPLEPPNGQVRDFIKPVPYKAKPDRPPTHGATGPRTQQGKQRSKFNARKHGLYAKAVLLEDESRAEYDALLNGLMGDFEPQGKLEAVLVENLAALMWRKRRLFQAETAEIEKAQFLNFDLELQNKVGELEYAQLGGSSDAKLRQSNPRNLLRDAIEILDLHRLLFAADDSQAVEGVRQTLKAIYGYEEEGPQPYSWRQTFLMLSKLLSKAEAERQDRKNQPDVQQTVVEAICKEMMRLGTLHDFAVEVEALKREHNLAGARVPSQAVSDRLIRYEAHLSREIDRILSRLERLQRVRKGQPLPPQVDVNIS